MGEGGGGNVLKLFAKHQKVSEQAAELQRTTATIVVGTPNRLHRLCGEGGALDLSDCRLLVLDSRHRDTKTFTLLSLQGVTADLMLLFKEHVIPALRAKGSQMKVVLM